MATITENLETLKANVARMKEAIGVPPETPLEDITKTVEDNSKTIQTGVYVVDDESELESLTAKEGELAIKYENTLRHPDATEALTSLYFPDSFTLDTAVTTSSYGMYRDTSQTIYRTRIYLTSATFYVMDEYEYTQIVRYTSEDGKTYTKQEAYKDVMEYTFPGNQVKYSGTTTTYLNGMFVKSTDFKLWRYVEGLWNYADIGCEISEDQIFMPGEAYSNNGKVVGTLDKNLWRNGFIYFQSNEPENKKGIWCTLKTSQLYSYSKYSKSCPIEITEQDINNTENTFKLIRNSLFRVVPGYSSTAFQYYTCNNADVVSDLTIYYNGSSTGYTYYGVLIDGKYYGLDRSTRKMYLFDFINNSRTTKATPPSTLSSYYILDVAYNNNKIYYLTRNSGSSSSGYTGRMFIYDISANTWSNYSLGNPGSSYTMPYSMIVTDNYLYYTYKNSSNTELVYIRKMNISNMSLVSTLSIDMTNDLSNEDTRPNFIYTFRLSYDSSYNSDGNIIYSPTHRLDLSTFTKDAIIEQMKSDDYKPSLSPDTFRDDMDYYYSYPYQKYYLSKVNIETRKEEIIPYGVSDGNTLQCTINFMFNVGDIIYAFKQTGTQLYSINIDNCSLLQTYNPVIQTSTDGEKIEIVEGINLKVKDVWTYNYNGTHMNGVDKIYIGDGTEWKLFKTNS